MVKHSFDRVKVRKQHLKHISISHIHDYKNVGSQQHPALQGVKENSWRLKSIQILTSNMGEWEKHPAATLQREKSCYIMQKGVIHKWRHAFRVKVKGFCDYSAKCVYGCQKMLKYAWRHIRTTPKTNILRKRYGNRKFSWRNYSKTFLLNLYFVETQKRIKIQRVTSVTD